LLWLTLVLLRVRGGDCAKDERHAGNASATEQGFADMSAPHG
jgi:hypothetical protein